MRFFTQIKKHIFGLFVQGGLGKVYNVCSFREYMRAKTKYLAMLGIEIPDFEWGRTVHISRRLL